ncbi:PhnD/SsuA/transferrin family substrate-binding protein [Zhengella sp. ZM62]|uniref:PhnD/SsuA/transferrin family substrate-binding protein n=1 Tax=Zhengella sedimenti TaxID=3390035 RepID=UPI003976AAEB
MTRIAATFLAGSVLVASLPGAAAGADWREEKGTFRIGIAAQGGPPDTAGASLIRAAYADALGLPVELVVARDYAALIDAQAAGRVDYGIYSAMAYVAARRYCACVEAIAAPVSATGATGSRAVVIRRLPVSGDGGSYILAHVETGLPGALEALAPGGDPEGASPVGFATGEEALQAFIDGRTDALAGHVLTGPGGDIAGTGTMALLGARGLSPAGLTIALRGPVLAFGPHAVSTTLDAEAKTILRGFLSGLAQARPDLVEALSPRFPGGFHLVGDAGYEGAAAMLDGILEKEKTRPAGE